jgi:hypothetical protein
VAEEKRRRRRGGGEEAEEKRRRRRGGGEEAEEKRRRRDVWALCTLVLDIHVHSKFDKCSWWHQTANAKLPLYHKASVAQ